MNANFVYSSTEAPGAYPNGSRVEKIGSEANDGHQDGDLGTVCGSTEAIRWNGEMVHGYFIRWDDDVTVPVFISGTRIQRKKESDAEGL